MVVNNNYIHVQKVAEGMRRRKARKSSDSEEGWAEENSVDDELEVSIDIYIPFHADT